MKAMPHYLSKLLVLCVSLMLLVMPLINTAHAFDRPVFRVGYVDEPGYFYKNDQGEYEGYTLEMLYAVAAQGNFVLQIVEFASYEAEDQALREGKIDMETTVPYSAERAEKFLFSDTPTLNVSLTLLVRSDDTRFQFGDINAVNGLNVGLIKNDASAEAFLAWCQKNQLHPQTVYYDNMEQQVAALKKGEIDSLTNSTEIEADSRCLLYYSHAACFAIFNMERKDLQKLFDTTLQQTLANNPLLKEQLQKEYLQTKSINLNVTTQRENAFRENHKEITVAFPESDVPFVYAGSDGKIHGIFPDYYDMLSKETGLHFVYQIYPDNVKAMEAVQQGKAQVLGLYTGTPAQAYRSGLRLIDVADARNLVRVAKIGNQGKKAAIATRSIKFWQQKLAGQGYELIPYKSIEAAYNALQDNKVDCILCIDVMATWLFNNYRMEGCTNAPLSFAQKFYTAIPVQEDNALFNILSKGALKTAPKYSSAVLANVVPQNNLRGLLARLPFWGLTVFAVIMAALVLLLAVLIVLLRRRYKEKSRLATRETENEKEKIRLEALEKNAEAKNQFFADISHDMRTPLNAIIGFSDLAMQTGELPVLTTYLQKINSSGKLMLDLVNDTLTMSKLSSGKLELKLEPVLSDPYTYFATVFDVIREQAARKKITLTITGEPAEKRWVMLDKLNMQKVLLNLLSNAVKYTPEGGHINVRFWNETGADGKLDSLFSVQDDGIGMAPDFQDHVFDPFTQENRSGYENTGTGLGLTIVKQLVGLMGGSITLSSVKDKGSTFTVRFRLQNAKEGEIALDDTPAPVTTERLAGHTILLCEDNLLNREITCALLKTKGLKTVTANNGRLGVEAFAASAPGEFAVILMDLRMPELDGYGATVQIRKLSRPDAKTIPIIALTAETFAEDVQKCLDKGMNDHVAKPLVPQILFATLAKYIK